MLAEQKEDLEGSGIGTGAGQRRGEVGLESRHPIRQDLTGKVRSLELTPNAVESPGKNVSKGEISSC